MEGERFTLNFKIATEITGVNMPWVLPFATGKQYFQFSILKPVSAGSLGAAYSLNWGAREIWGKGGGETLALLW